MITITTTFPTNSHSSFDFNFFAFNPWELYTQGCNHVGTINMISGVVVAASAAAAESDNSWQFHI